MPTAENRTTAIRAILLFLGAILCFDVMSVLVRVLLAEYSAQELSAYRNVFGVLPSLMLLVWSGELRLRGARLRLRQWRLAVFRGLVVAVAQLLWYWGLGHLELATVATLGQSNALFTVLVGIVVLRERVGIWRWSAVFLGFAGVLMILQPGSDAFSAAALFPIGAAACYAISMVTVRLFDEDASNALVYVYASGASAIGAILLASVTTEFTPLRNMVDAGMILTMSIMGGIGVLLMMLAYRMTAPAVLAPFSYFGILTAFGLGWLIFDEAPIDTLLPGALLIVAAGALIIWRANRR
jgi:drug/metabolite transporter (DMT)-like permease